MTSVGTLEFEKPDTERFPCLSLAYDALKIGGTMPAILNAANEISVSAFLEKKIGFGEIARINKEVMSSLQSTAADTIDAVISADREARVVATRLVAEVASTAVAA